MKVSTNELHRATALLLRHLEHSGQKEFEISEDYYWNISPAARYDPYNEPKEITVGQLSDDWSEVKHILEGQREPLGYALVWLAAVLRRVGEMAIG